MFEGAGIEDGGLGSDLLVESARDGDELLEEVLAEMDVYIQKRFHAVKLSSLVGKKRGG